MPDTGCACRPIPCPICGAPLKFIPDNPFWLPFFSCTGCFRSYELMRGRSLRACRCCGQAPRRERPQGAIKTTSSNPCAIMVTMLGATDLLAINLEILHATISGFAVRGYSGDLEFRAYLGQVLRSKIEVHMELAAASERGRLNAEVMQSIATNWPPIDVWLEHPSTILQVSFQRGRITRVRIKEPTPPPA